MKSTTQTLALRASAAVINSTSTTPVAESRTIAAAIKAYRAAQAALLQREEFLEAELSLIRAARKHDPQPQPRRQRRPYGVLTGIVRQLLAVEPLSKQAILERLAAQGMQLGDKPKEVLDSIIYCRHNFTRAGKLFTLTQPVK